MMAIPGFTPPIPPLTEERVLETLNGLERLPTLPALARRLIDAVESPASGAREVTAVLRSDQAISMQVLRVANSAYYGLVTRVAALERAIMVLGFDEIRRIALAVSVIRAMPPIPGVPGFRVEDFWTHALGCAHAARFVAEAAGERAVDEAYTAGLLHDIGKIVAAQHFPRHFGLVIHCAGQFARPPHEVEPLLLGCDHATIGRWLATMWSLPASLAAAIGHHHAVEAAAGSERVEGRLPRLVALANALAHRAGIGDGIGAAPPPSRAHAEAFGLDDGALRGIGERLAAARAAIRTHLA